MIKFNLYGDSKFRKDWNLHKRNVDTLPTKLFNEYVHKTHQAIVQMTPRKTGHLRSNILEPQERGYLRVTFGVNPTFSQNKRTYEYEYGSVQHDIKHKKYTTAGTSYHFVSAPFKVYSEYLAEQLEGIYFGDRDMRYRSFPDLYVDPDVGESGGFDAGE